MELKKIIMKAIKVARISTEEQKENSPEAQLFRIQGYCDRKEMKVVKEFSFTESAYKEKRDEFDKLVEYVQEVSKKEKIAVCFDKVDRLSRSVFDKRVGILYEMAVADQIELHFISDNQIINNQMSAVEKFQFGMSLGLAKYYSDAIGDNVKRAFEKKRRNGELLRKSMTENIKSMQTNYRHLKSSLQNIEKLTTNTKQPLLALSL